MSLVRLAVDDWPIWNGKKPRGIKELQLNSEKRNEKPQRNVWKWNESRGGSAGFGPKDFRKDGWIMAAERLEMERKLAAERREREKTLITS